MAALNTRNRTQSKETIYCDDCGQEKMAEIHGGKLVIAARRHGRQHFAVVEVTRKIGGKRRHGKRN